jgi:hypothetical protein
MRLRCSARVLFVIVIAPAVMPTPFGVFIAERSSVLGHRDFVFWRAARRAADARERPSPADSGMEAKKIFS